MTQNMRPGGRAEWRFRVDVSMEDMNAVCVRADDAEDGVRWRQAIGCGHPWRNSPEGKIKDSGLALSFYIYCKVLLLFLSL